jgi:hypothetical protein
MRPRHRRAASPGYWTVPKEWSGETVFIVAGGPSVADQDTDRLKGRNVIVVNSSYERCPFAQYLFFGDRSWWARHSAKVLKSFEGRIVTTSMVANSNGRLHRLKRIPPSSAPLATNPSNVVWKNTSLHGAINIAVHTGAGRIVLLGADMRKAPDGRSHHHTPHPKPSRPGCWGQHMRQLKLTAEPLQKLGIDVVNASPVSLIDWWPKVRFEDCL